jgi:hypothetical protein
MVGALEFSYTASQGAHHRRPALSGSRFQISGNASQGVNTVHTAITSRMFYQKYFLGPHAAED